MAAAKTTSTVKTLQAPKRVTAKAAAMRGETKKTAAKKAPGETLKASSEGDALDVLRLFIKTYANL